MEMRVAYPLFVTYGRAERLYAPDTMRNMVDAFRNWIDPALGHKEVEAIDLPAILRLRESMLQAKLSIARQYGITMWIKAFLAFCRTHLKLKCLDPTSVSLPRRPPPVVAYLKDDEVAAFVGAIRVHTYAGKRLRALVELLLGTGLRIGEALALNRASFDNGKREVRLVSGKTRAPRTVFITERAARWVELYLRHRDDNHPALFVTTSARPSRVARADVSRMFRDVRIRAGVAKKVTPHLLRHTYCTNLLNHGADIRFIRDLAGHRDIQTTARYYLGVDDAKLREVVDSCLDYGDNDHSDERAVRAQPPVLTPK